MVNTNATPTPCAANLPNTGWHRCWRYLQANVKFVSIAMLVVGLSSGLALSLFWRTQLHQVPAFNDTQPDMFAEKLNSVDINAQGEASRRFATDFLLAFEADATASAKAPRIQLTLEHGDVLELQAHHGIAPSRDTLQLVDDVQITLRMKNNLVMYLTGPRIDYAIKPQIATSTQTITVSSPSRFTLSGTGFYADLKTQQYQLQQQVRGTYEPTPHTA